MTLKPTIYCYHGSPGTSRDFHTLAGELCDFALQPVARGQTVSTASSDSGGTFYCGYSWGSLLALRDGARDKGCRGIILIAPFLGPDKPLPTTVTRLLRSIPLPRALISVMKDSIVAKFLRKTSAPCAIPTAYADLQADLANTGLLYDAILEKHEVRVDFATIFAQLALAGPAVLVIHGERDQVTGASAHAAFIRDLLPEGSVKAIPDGPHALLWTHAGQIAKMIENFCKSALSQKGDRA